ncbi:MAG: hypothetical protein MHPSP_003831, partial [Paramarteilia canceri]
MQHVIHPQPSRLDRRLCASVRNSKTNAHLYRSKFSAILTCSPSTSFKPRHNSLSKQRWMVSLELPLKGNSVSTAQIAPPLSNIESDVLCIAWCGVSKSLITVLSS